MAKSDSFFLRASVFVDDDAAFQQTSIDLGAYVDALGKSVLRIHNIEYEWAQGVDGNVGAGAPTMDGDKSGAAIWQLTTQSQTGLVPLTDKSVIGKGQLWARNSDEGAMVPAMAYSDGTVPQHFSEGYLVAVEQIYLGGFATDNWTETDQLTCNMVLECTVETLTQSAAMALALSQQ